MQAPFESQGRGFEHGHGKGHGLAGATMKWLRKAVGSDLRPLAKKFQQAVLAMAETVQYESARESARQMNVLDLPLEPFTVKQQRQTRMDGGEDDDGSFREFVPLGPPVVQPHIEREQNRAAAANRPPLTGTAAYKDLPITGAFQSTFPMYRQRFSFASLGSPIQPTAGDLPYRNDAKLFTVDEAGQINGILMPDGTEANQDAVDADAVAWATHFARDTFNNHCSNHEHNCIETCVKYVKKKQEAKLSLRSTKVPSCRFRYYRVKQIHKKRVRRRGKPLVSKPFVEGSDARNEQFRCQLKRETPLRSTSNDVCQSCDRCNCDFQYLVCAPPDDALEDDAALLVPDNQPSDCVPPCVALKDDATELVPDDQPAKRRRLTKKTPGGTKNKGPKWLYGCDAKRINPKLLLNFSEAFRKAYGMDFYITKYQGKMMESLTPLFQTMQTGIQRLEQQEREEAERSKAGVDQVDTADEAAKKAKTEAESAARARRVTVRLASMANRCYWLSTTEITTHILTGGDVLQTHHNARLFTRQLHWTMQECKRALNKEAPLEDTGADRQSLQTAVVQLRVKDEIGSDDDASQSALDGDAPEPAEDGASLQLAEDGDASRPAVEVTAVDVDTTSTNTSDDYAHRGIRLQSMPFYVYRMYVIRVARKSDHQAHCLFEFEQHYCMANRYIQKLCLSSMNVPTLDGFQCPTWDQDPEQNSLLKSMLFTPWVCGGPLLCGNSSRFRHMLARCGCADRSTESRDAPQLAEVSATQFTFERAWRLRCSEIHVLAARADTKCHAARTHLVMEDTTLFANLQEPREAIRQGEDIKKFTGFTMPP